MEEISSSIKSTEPNIAFSLKDCKIGKSQLIWMHGSKHNQHGIEI